MHISNLTFFLDQIPVLGIHAYANSADPVQMPQKAGSTLFAYRIFYAKYS